MLENEEVVKLAKCPRCGSELRSISDLDLEGHYVRCYRCGYTDDWITWDRSVVWSIGLESTAQVA